MIKNTILVISGKGGVGKTTIASNLALGLSLNGFKIGLLDVDMHTPNIPVIFGIENENVTESKEKGLMLPYSYNDTLKIMSIGLMLEDKDAPIIWRGPMKSAFIKKFMKETKWGDLDYMIVDCPPGTGDELLSIVSDSENLKGAVVVTTPQKMALVDAKKAVNFCRAINLSVLGIIENMSGFACPKCGEITYIFAKQGGEQLAKEAEVAFLGKIPLDLQVVDASEQGIPLSKAYPDSLTYRTMQEIFAKI